MRGKQKRAVIGIVPAVDLGGQFLPIEDVERIFARRDYSKLIAAVGAVPVMLTPDTPLDYIIGHMDGVVISGGQDILPRLYNHQRTITHRIIEPAVRYRFEKKLIKACDKVGLPILGICYGMQILNVYYGGTLIQDIESMVPENIGHFETEHEIRFETNFLGMREMEIHRINSRHHQAVDELAPGFKVAATASDGIIEAIEGHGHFGIQWHPESDATGAHVYRAFAEHCMGISQTETVY